MSSFHISLDQVWTKFGQLCQVSVQKTFIGQDLDRHLTEFGHGRKSLDRDWTVFVLLQDLDKVWTYIGRSLDKVWIFCPMSVQPHKGKEHQKPLSHAQSTYMCAKHQYDGLPKLEIYVRRTVHVRFFLLCNTSFQPPAPK